MILKPNILIISSRADYGGGPEHIYKLTKNLKSNFNFYFAVPDDIPYYQHFLNLVGKERIIKIPHRKFTFKSLIELVRFIKTNSIQIVHSHGKGAGVYSRLLRLFLKVKVIHTFHGIHVGNYNEIQKFLYLTIERLFSFFTTKFINVSASENRLTKEYKICPDKKIILIENGVELPEKAIEEKQFDIFPRIVITFTRFDFAKNTELIIPILLHLKKLDRIQEFRFHIYGEGPSQKQIESLVSKYQLEKFILFCGTTNNTTKLLLTSFCYLSTSRWEGLPLGILESFAAGLPVVATDVIGNNDVIDDSINGLLYKLDSPDQAAEKLLKLSDDKNLWLNLSKKSRMKAESEYNITKMIDKTAGLYLNIIESD